jgi:hypothetical protein
MRGRLLPLVLLVGTLAVATGAAVRAAEPARASGALALGLGHDVVDAVVAGSIVRPPEVVPRELDGRRDVAVWIACSCALAALGIWVLVRNRVARRTVARAWSARRTRAPPVTDTVVCC